MKNDIMIKFSKDINLRKILIGKDVTYSSIKIGKVFAVKIEDDRVIITAKIDKKCRNIIKQELQSESPTMIVADLGIQLTKE